MHMVRALLDEHYNLYQLFIDAKDVGHAGMRRPRTYIICAHKRRCVCLRDPQSMFDNISRTIAQAVQTVPQDYLIAPSTTQALMMEKVCLSRGLEFDPVPRLNKHQELQRAKLPYTAEQKTDHQQFCGGFPRT